VGRTLESARVWKDALSSESPTILKVDGDKRVMSVQLISCHLPKADSTLLSSSLIHYHFRVIASSSGGLAWSRGSLCRGLGSRWFTERFHRNALVIHFQDGQVFCTAWRLEHYGAARCRLHQRAPQR